MSNRALAEQLGCPEQCVWRWRRARSKPSERYLRPLADAMFDGQLAALYEEHDDDAVAAA